MSALDIQVGGDHYKEMPIQPMEFCLANKLDYATSNVIKYVTRKKGDKDKRREDLNKAIHSIQLLAEHFSKTRSAKHWSARISTQSKRARGEAR